MMKSYHSYRAGEKNRGFTLVELLVVIGIIALLISILLPALNRAKAQAVKIQCAANLRTLGQSMQAYAAENKSKLPQHSGGGTPQWIWDFAYWSRDYMIKCGAVRKSFYCPDNIDTQGRDADWWFSTGGSPLPQTKGITDSAGFSVVGYNILIERPGKAFNLVDREMQDSTKPKRSTTGNINVPTRSTDTEIVTESVTLSGSDYRTALPYIQGGLSHYTPHLIKGKAEGGNILFLDGHVDWRSIGKMKVRWQASATANFFF